MNNECKVLFSFYLIVTHTPYPSKDQYLISNLTPLPPYTGLSHMPQSAKRTLIFWQRCEPGWVNYWNLYKIVINKIYLCIFISQLVLMEYMLLMETWLVCNLVDTFFIRNSYLLG